MTLTLKRFYWRLRELSIAEIAKGFRRKSGAPSIPSKYLEWIDAFDNLTSADRTIIRRRIADFHSPPLISVIMPVYNTPEKWLRRAIESVRNQIYPHWELCIADDASPSVHVREILSEYRRMDPRIKVVFREENGHISAASNSALELACGDFIALLDHDDELAEHALYMVATEIERHPDADLIYSDEDMIDEAGRRFKPHFKSDWNPELILSQNFFCHLGVYRTSLVQATGGFINGYEGSQDYDLLLRCAASTKPERIRHIPHILYHWRAIEGSTALNIGYKNYAETAALKMLKDHLQRTDARINVELARPGSTTYRVRYPLPVEPPLVSIIIPTRDGHQLLRQCVESLLSTTTYPRYQLLIVDNQSTETEALEYFRHLEFSGTAKVLRYDHPFNYSAINNFAVRMSDGEVLCFMNNDITVKTPGWLEEMVSHAVRPSVGAVGAKLLYPDGFIQHGGVILGIRGIAGHSHKHYEGSELGYFRRLALTQNLSAVTGACLVIRKVVFESVGGFDETNLPIAYNDVDLCLRVGEMGLLNVWTPCAELFHHESATRGSDDTPENEPRLRKEAGYMRQRWQDKLKNDPYYNPNLTLETQDFALAWPPRAHKPWVNG